MSLVRKLERVESQLSSKSDCHGSCPKRGVTTQIVQDTRKLNMNETTIAQTTLWSKNMLNILRKELNNFRQAEGMQILIV